MMDSTKSFAAPPAETKLHFLDYWRIIRVRKTVILTVFMLVVLTTTLVTQFLPPTYESVARIEVEKDMPDVEGFRERPMLSSFDPYWMQTQFEIIKSSTVLDAVINKLKLSERFSERDGMQVPYRMDETRLLLRRMVDLNLYRNTTIIEIRVESQKPEEAAEIANAIADAYRDYRQRTRLTLVEKGIQTLQDELKLKEQESTLKESNVVHLRRYLEINDIDPYSGRVYGTLDSETIRRLDAVHVDAQARYVELNAQYTKLAQMSRTELKRSLLTVQPDSILMSLLEDLNKTEQQLALNAEDYGEAHPEYKRLVQLLNTQERLVDERLTGILEGIKALVDKSKAGVEELSRRLDEAKKKDREAGVKLMEYYVAKEESETARTVKNALAMRIQAAILDNQKIQYSVVKMVDQAEPILRPVRPKKILNIALGVMAGLVLGVGLAFFVEYLDTSVKTIDDVERALQAPVLGVIPQNVGNLMEEGPESPHAEAYRVLRTNLLFSRKDDRWNSLTVVSAGAGEGKSTTLFNLAVVFAQNGNRVLLVDSDLRRPSLHKRLGVSNSVGLTNFLLKQNTLAEVIQTTSLPTLDFMPSGKLPSSALGILNSTAMKEMIGELKRRYDFVFFDSPPIMGISDASILASEVDMTLQIIQYRRYPQPMTIRAKQMIEKVGGNLMGIVLNNINMSSDSYYYYYSGYFEESYYKDSEDQSSSRRKSKRGGGDSGRETAEVEIKQKY